MAVSICPVRKSQVAAFLEPSSVFAALVHVDLPQSLLADQETIWQLQCRRRVLQNSTLRSSHGVVLKLLTRPRKQRRARGKWARTMVDTFHRILTGTVRSAMMTLNWIELITRDNYIPMAKSELLRRSIPSRSQMKR